MGCDWLLTNSMLVVVSMPPFMQGVSVAFASSLD